MTTLYIFLYIAGFAFSCIWIAYPIIAMNRLKSIDESLKRITGAEK